MPSGPPGRFELGTALTFARSKVPAPSGTRFAVNQPPPLQVTSFSSPALVNSGGTKFSAAWEDGTPNWVSGIILLVCVLPGSNCPSSLTGQRAVNNTSPGP